MGATIHYGPQKSPPDNPSHRPERRCPCTDPRQPRGRSVLRAGIAALTATVATSALPATAVADATDDYPIPHRMIAATCTAEQILAAARDFTPIYYERYMIDKHNKSTQVQQAAIDSAHYFYSLTPADRRAYSEQMVTNFADPTTAAWPNWAKSFFNNIGVTAIETDHCSDYPAADLSVWDRSPARRRNRNLPLRNACGRTGLGML
jgi:hypothetical protein